MTTTYKFRWKGNWDEVQADDRSRAVQKVIKKIGLPLRQGLRAMADNQLLVVRADLMGGLTESINEKSVSQNQQKLMGMAYALKKGEMSSSEASQEVKDLAKSMTLQQLKDFAGTKHKGLPQKKGQMEMKLTESKLRQIIRSIIREEFIVESVNEANIGDKMKHKYIDGVSIELLDTTNKGWKVKQTGDGTPRGKNKTKIAYYYSIDITGGDKALFVKESVNESSNDKQKVVDYLVKKGNNKNDAQKMVDKNYDYVSNKYKGASVSKKAEIISGLQESVNEESYKIAGRPVTLNKGKKSNGTDWTVTFNNGKTVSLSDVLSLIKPFPKGITKESTNESVNENFIPGVGSIDDFMLKDMLIKNSKVNAMLDAKSKAFIKKPEVVVIMHQSKRFNNIFTDGKMELEIDTKSNKVVKPLGKARKAISDYFKNN